jgi:TniQ
MEKKKTSKTGDLLYSVPPPIALESPASWMTRAALSQGASLREFCRFLKLNHRRDIDLCFTREVIRNVALKCGFDPRSFDFGRHMFTGLMSFDRRGDRFLLFGKSGARYRYCPVCLNEQEIKHFPVHWRFKAWRYCPTHDCLMEDRCRSCGIHIELPTHLMDAGPDQAGVAFLHQCPACAKILSSHWKKVNRILDKGVLEFDERRALHHGRAVLATIYQRHLYYTGIEKQYRMKALIGLAKAGSIPHENFYLDAGELERRLEQWSPL